MQILMAESTSANRCLQVVLCLLLKLQSKLTEGIGTEAGEPTRGSKTLELISCELETRKFDNCQEVQYISSSEKPFEIIRRDFGHAEHLAEIREITKAIFCSLNFYGKPLAEN